MSTTTAIDFMNSAPADHAPAHMVDGGRLIVRIAQRLIGSALVLAALGMWVIPGSDWGADLALMKLMISLCLGLCGIGLIHAGKEKPFPEVEIDMIRREARLVRRDQSDVALLARCKFDDLAKVEHEGEMVRLWDSNDVLLAEVTLSDPTTRRSLLSALRLAGKL